MVAKTGDKVEIVTEGQTFKGVLMPVPEAEEATVIIKLDNGYNIGIDKKNIKKIKVIEEYKEKEARKEKVIPRKNLPTISILHTGGTIASKVDYRTGAVVSRFSPEELFEMFPELSNIANIKSQLIFQMFSEDMEPEHWGKLAETVKEELESGADGVIITHGTDTMGYTAAALSFMIENLGSPVVLVGAQRSSDRGSSDAATNLLCAAQFITKSDFAGVVVCMHENPADESCLVHLGTKVRKLHTSRRDAFKSVNSLPVARISPDGKIEFFVNNYNKKSNNKINIKNNFEKKVAIVKMHPGFDYKLLEFFELNHYRGVVLEGTGLGHAPTNVLDEHTKQHKQVLETIKRMAKKMFVIMTSQCIYGRVNMNVYSSGRDLLDAAVISAEDMLPETAFVKLGWLLGNYPKQEVKALFAKDLRGEITKRTQENTFIE